MEWWSFGWRNWLHFRPSDHLTRLLRWHCGDCHFRGNNSSPLDVRGEGKNRENERWRERKREEKNIGWGRPKSKQKVMGLTNSNGERDGLDFWDIAED